MYIIWQMLTRKGSLFRRLQRRSGSCCKHMLDATVCLVLQTVYSKSSPPKRREIIVNLQSCTCSCWPWQTSGIPCAHVLAISLSLRADPQKYANSFFGLANYRSTYKKAILPPNTYAVDDVQVFTALLDNSEDDSDIVLPPSTRRPPVHAKKRRIRGLMEGEDRAKRSFCCSRCSSTGHSKCSCTAPIE